MEVCQLINHSIVSGVFTFIALTSNHSSLAKGQASFCIGTLPCGVVLYFSPFINAADFLQFRLKIELVM